MSEIYPAGQGARAPKSQTASVDKKSAEVIGGGSSAGALCGLGAAVLAIIGLAGVLRLDLGSVALIAAGAALVFQGGAVAARMQQIRADIAEAEGHKGEVAMESGVTAEMVGGIGAIVLGILALIHIAPVTLFSIGVIVLGGTLLLGSGAAYETIDVTGRDETSTNRTMDRTHKAASSAAGVDVMVGLAAVTLGILNVIGATHTGANTGAGGFGGSGLADMSLSLVGVLVVGIGELLTDSTLAGRMTAIFRHH